MIEKTTPSEAWRECTPGELVELGAQHRRREARRVFVRNLSFAAAGCAVTGTLCVLLLKPRGQSWPPAGIACEDVTRLLPAYAAKQLDPDRTAQIRKHLAACPHCSEALRKLQQAS